MSYTSTRRRKDENGEWVEYEVLSLDTAETAKLIVRPALKAAFPGVRFSVRSQTYSGGSSIDVTWVDGPTQQDVRKVTEPLAGADFDGMIDLKTHRDPKQMADGTFVSYGADYIHGQRGYSREWIEQAWVAYDAQKPSNVTEDDPYWGFTSYLHKTPGPVHSEKTETTYDYSRPEVAA